MSREGAEKIAKDIVMWWVAGQNLYDPQPLGQKSQDHLRREIVQALAAERARVRAETWRAAEWPNVVAPAQYEHPAEGWEDPKLPDFQLIWKLARDVGYAVGLHGSLKRDVDLIAAPWTDEAIGNYGLIQHLCAGLNAKMVGLEHKPHGRVAVTLQIDGYYKPIDLSILARLAQQAEGGVDEVDE